MEGLDFGAILHDALAQFSTDLLAQLQTLLQDTFSGWMANTAPAMFARLLTMAFGALAQWLWMAAGGALGGLNIFTQLPPQWNYGLQPVQDMRHRLTPIAAAVLSVALVGGLVWGGLSMLLGKPFSRLLSAIPTFLLCTAGLLVAPDICRWWIDFVNAASGALLDPLTGLPGLDAIRNWEYTSALGVVAIVYLAFAVMFLLSRIKLIVVTALLLVASPLAIASGALPFSPAQRFFSWWLSTFIGATVVQVLQAVCLGLGAALLSAPFLPGHVEGPAEGVISASIGIGSIMAAMALPGMLLGGLGTTNLPLGGVLSTALWTGAALSGMGWLPGMLGSAGRYASAWAMPPRAAVGGVLPLGSPTAALGGTLQIRSLLGDGAMPRLTTAPQLPRAPLMLPPPKPA